MFELRHLRYFLVVAEELHFSRAAARLNMSQPPLSQQIRGLEEAVGTPLFVRNRRSVALTTAGRELYEQVGPWLAGLDDIAERVRRVGEGEVGTLRIGCNFTTTQGLLPTLVQAFTQRYPAVSVRLQEATTDQQVDWLVQGRLDVGLVRLPVNAAHIEALPLYEESLVVAMPRGHRLARRTKLSLRDLRDEQFLNASRRPVGPFQSVQSQCRSAGFEPRLSEVSGNANSAIALVGAGMGIALVPESMARILPAEVIYKPLADSPTSTVAVARRRSGASPTALLFVELAARWREQGAARAPS
ncbi:LysR family transcriptional regulator [Ramlibacter rhizophilus]|uniref:LysR family transcriptional regulator n=1 Tax=Ramlibacter rhizophilus TaxID=1781167 RepID=A0A4Z0BDI9_9BURK|nr:LysR substrate-binding domain-containing protein [Ramlibacter rhizophilus]TFY97342.1 LysR family transcriptional regulator [Ramlibacter rhizophilus]